MKIRLVDIEIDDVEPFKACKLDRLRYAEVLTDVVKGCPEGFVLAINNRWGTGKTTFVKMWRQHLTNAKLKNIYFNAWENDFDDVPLIAIMAELQTLTGKSNKRAFDSALQKGAVLSKNVLPGFLKAVTKRYIDTQEIIDAIESATKATTEIFQSEIDEYAKKKESIRDFRTRLEDFVEKTDDDNPIVFIIDELDRCRPDYAIQVLEQMKHFFSVPGIIFVLSIDKQHLAASVCGFYGSDRIDTDEYLRRFIDMEYSIPEPSTEQFCKYLYSFYSFDEFFKSRQRHPIDIFRGDGDKFLKMSHHLFQKVGATLRQMEKVFGQSRLILSAFKGNQVVWPEVLFVLVYLSVLKRDIYLRLTANEISLQEISDIFGKFAPTEPRLGHFFTYTLARLLNLYNTDQEHVLQKVLVEDDEGKKKTFIKYEPDESLAEALYYIKQEFDFRDVGLSYLLGRIDLMEPLIVETA